MHSEIQGGLGHRDCRNPACVWYTIALSFSRLRDLGPCRSFSIHSPVQTFAHGSGSFLSELLHGTEEVG